MEYSLMEYTLDYTKMTTFTSYQVSDKDINELIHKIKLVLSDSDESSVNNFNMHIDFYENDSTNLHDILSLVYDEIIVKRSNLIEHVKTVRDGLTVEFYTKAIKYSENDTFYHQIQVALQPYPSILDATKQDEDKNSIVVHLDVNTFSTTYLAISISRKVDDDEE